jgi:hypothetical protein
VVGDSGVRGYNGAARERWDDSFVYFGEGVKDRDARGGVRVVIL